LAILHSFIAKKQWQFGNFELLTNRWRFGYDLLLNACWQFCNSLSLNICWKFWQLLIAYIETIDLVAFIGLGGVNNVSHMFLFF
jgi:hypothetical protein